jgi:hypothetical protein
LTIKESEIGAVKHAAADEDFGGYPQQSTARIARAQKKGFPSSQMEHP